MQSWSLQKQCLVVDLDDLLDFGTKWHGQHTELHEGLGIFTIVSTLPEFRCGQQLQPRASTNSHSPNKLLIYFPHNQALPLKKMRVVMGCVWKGPNLWVSHTHHVLELTSTGCAPSEKEMTVFKTSILQVLCQGEHPSLQNLPSKKRSSTNQKWVGRFTALPPWKQDQQDVLNGSCKNAAKLLGSFFHVFSMQIWGYPQPLCEPASHHFRRVKTALNSEVPCSFWSKFDPFRISSTSLSVVYPPWN